MIHKLAGWLLICWLLAGVLAAIGYYEYMHGRELTQELNDLRYSYAKQVDATASCWDVMRSSIH